MPDKAVVLDANLLVLLAVDRASPEHIVTHKRLGSYSKADFDLLAELLARASRHTAFSRLGLTDCVVLETATADSVIVTADLGLFLEASSQGREAINFNQLRAGIP